MTHPPPPGTASGRAHTVQSVEPRVQSVDVKVQSVDDANGQSVEANVQSVDVETKVQSVDSARFIMTVSLWDFGWNKRG